MSRFKQLRDDLGELVASAVPDVLSYARTPSAIQEPAVVVSQDAPFARYWIGSGRSTRYRLRLVFLISKEAEETAQQLLDDWASDDGPIIGVLHDADLDDIEILSVTGAEYGRVAVGSAEYLGFSLIVEIEA